MGYTIDPEFSGGGGSTRATPPSRAPLPSSMSQPPSSSASFGRIDLTSAAVTGIQMAATAPGYIYERPLAALNTIGKSKPEDKGLIDQAGDTIRNIPVLGDLLSGGAQAVGNTIEGSGRIFPALANSWVATALNDNYGRGENEKVSGVAATLINFNPDMTVGELRQYAAQRGFTPDDELNIHTGKSGIFDFADKSISANPLLDLGGRMVIDPLNVIAFGGAGALAKGAIKGASLGGKIFDGTTMMSRIDKLATGAKALEDAVGLSRTGFKSTVAGMRALRAGDISGVTLNTFGRHLAMMSRGSSDFLRAYRKVAIGTTAAQLGLQELAKSDITDNTPLSPIMDTLYEAADRMAEDKPLSEGMLFNLWAAVNFPIRDGLSDAWQSTRANGLGIGIGKATLRTPLLRRITDIEKYVVKELAPGKNFKDGRAYLIGRFGSEDRFQDHIMHFTRSLVTEDPNTAMPALTNQPATTAEFHATAEANNRVWDAATRARVESGEIDGRAVFEHMRDKYRGTRSTSTNRTGGETEVTGRVARDWDPEDHIRQWNDWADRMEALNLKAGFSKGGNLVIGIMDGLMPKEHLVAAKRTLEAIAGPDGIIPKNRMDEFLNAFPALDADVNDPGNFFARLRAPDSGEVSKGAAIQRIDKLMKDPRTMTMREYLYGVEQMQKRAESIKTKRGTVLDENGMPDPTRAPDIGQAAVLTPTLKDSVRRQMGLDGLTLEDVHASRGEARTRAIEDDVAAVIDESGFNLRAAVQGIVSRGGKKVTALSLHLDSKTDVGSLELAGAIALRRTGADRATILYSGAESLTTHGLTANAAHTRFDIGKMSSDEAARVLDAAVEAFDGQFELNDTAGVLHVVVKPGQEDAVQALTDLIDGVVGRDRVSVSHEPAWFQVIRNDMRSGGRGRATAGESSARAIWDAARGDLRLVNSERKFSERAIRSAEYATATSKGARDSRGVLGETRTGFTRRPESARTGSDGLGPDQPRGVEVPTGFTANSSEVRVRRGSDQGLNNPDPDGAMYHATTALSQVMSEGLRSRRQTGKKGLGGAEFEDDLSFKNKVSITYRKDFAEAIAERFRMVARAARGNITPEEVYAYFAPKYTKFPIGSLDDFKAAWPEDSYTQAYRIKELDDGLYSEPGQTGVGITNVDGIAALDPSEIGVVRVAIRGDVPVVHKPAEFELKVNPREVAVIDGPPVGDAKKWLDDLEVSGVRQSPTIQAHDASGSQGQVVFLAEADDALEALTPRLTADLGGEGRTDLGGLDPVQIEKIKGLETELRQYDPQYRIKIAPTQGNVATYYPGQGNAIKDLMATSRAASDLLTFKRWSKAAAFWDLMFRPVQTSKLGDEAKQALYRELLGRTAHLPDDKTIRIKDIDSFLQTANAAARQNRILGAQTYARGELLDIKTLTAIADGSFAKDLTNNTGGIFQGFTPEALAAIGGAKHIHKILDRTGSRFFRDLEKRTRGTPARPREMSAKDLTDWQVSYYAKDGPEWVDVYHGTSNAKTLLKDGRFKLGPGGFDVLNTGEHRGSVFLTPDPTYARQFAGYGKSAGVQHPDPDVVRVQVRRGTGVVNGSELVIPIGQAGPQNVRIVGRASETRGDKGQLGRVMAETYGGVRSKTATPRHYIRTWYHLFRFTFDPRFHVMNHAEADMLGLMKYGHSTTRWGGARKEGVGKDGATQAHSRGGDMNADRLADALASGVLDARHLEGYIGRGFQVDRVRSTREVLRTLADEDPAAQALRREFGGTVDEWVDGLEETMYSFDTKGVDETITEAMAGILDEADRVAMEPLLIRLYERNRQIFKDVKSTFHGNTNRSNIERIMNSYFLYWPISYQLKAGKWLFDVLTKQSLGRKTNLGGAWYVNNLYQQHMERMARDETYQRIFTDNPALWFTASMLLPMTPWDMSVGMSRATRYMLAGVGIIDEPKFEEDPFMAAMRLAHIGPAYTIELAERMYRESKDRPRDLVVPVN